MEEWDSLGRHECALCFMSTQHAMVKRCCLAVSIIRRFRVGPTEMFMICEFSKMSLSIVCKGVLECKR